MDTPKYGLTILLSGTVLIVGGGALGASYCMDVYKRETVAPFISDWEHRVSDAFRRKAKQPFLHETIREEISANVEFLNTFDR